MEDPFTLLQTYFQQHAYPFTKHHIDSYRELLRRYIPETIASFNPITMVKLDPEDPNKVKLKVEVFVGGLEDVLRLYVDRPTYLNENQETVLLTPHEARLKNYSYMAHLFADVVVRYTEEHKAAPYTREFKKAWLGEIPIMLHSDICVLHEQSPEVLRKMGECPLDQGGYFIVDGKEKVLVSQERITTNRLFIESTPKDTNFSHRGHIHCTGERGETALSPRTIAFYWIRTELPASDKEDDVKEEYQSYRGAIVVSIPSIVGTYPLTTLFRLLGVESDRAILETIFGDVSEIPQPFIDALIPSLRHGASKGIFDQRAAVEHVAPGTYFKTPDQVYAILVNDIFPNMNPLPDAMDRVPPAEIYENKAKLLGHLVQDFVKTVMGIHPLSDRDGYVFKRVDVSGFLLAQLFQAAYIQVKNTCRDMLDAHYHYIIKNKGQLDKLITTENLRKFLQPTVLTEMIQRSMKGRWGPVPEDPDQEVVQDLGRISYIQYLSHVRRVNLPLDRSIKITSPHRLHAQQWGIMCPFESPDGASIGYLKNFALLAQITFGTDAERLMPCLLDLGMVPLTALMALETHRWTAVYLNGCWVGCHSEPHRLVRQLRLYRRNALINSFTSVSWDIPRQSIRVLTEPGRACRPLFIVETGRRLFQYRPNVQWFEEVFGKQWRSVHPEIEKAADLYNKSYYVPFEKAFPLKRGASWEDRWAYLEQQSATLEFLDIEEANTCLIAMTPDKIGSLTTHCELHPSTLFSVVTNNIPLANHNQAPRNIFYGAQSKQAIGIYATNFQQRFDTMAYIQHYPQRPLITTQNAQFIQSERLPGGFNVIVAVMTYSGFNQEDSIMINKASIDRGLFHITAYKSLTVSEEALNDQEEMLFVHPEQLLAQLRDGGEEDKDADAGAGVDTTEERQTAHIRNYHPDRTYYGLLDDDGIIQEESYLPKGEMAAIVGRVKRTRRFVKEQRGLEQVTVETYEYQDMTVRSDVHHYGRVDKVFCQKKTAKTPYRTCKVRFRKVRKPEFGDKHCSRHGQKGVIGMILREEDMPFTKDGIRPDIIINPHAFPSRMTIGHLVECIFAKLCCMEGTLGDGSVFVPLNTEVLGDGLEDHGFERFGNEILYNGYTGQMIASDIFIGPTYYLRLKHMVADKVHARGVGFMNPHDQMTRQPTSGRSHMGGLRIGEMERDALLSHGLAQFIKESMMERSDKYRWSVCRSCGTLAMADEGCRSCGSTEVSVVETPYAMKVLIQELEAMGLSMRLSADPVLVEEDVWVESDIPMVWSGGAQPPQMPPGSPVEFGGGDEERILNGIPEESDEVSEAEVSEAEAEASEAEAEARGYAEADEDDVDIESGDQNKDIEDGEAIENGENGENGENDEDSEAIEDSEDGENDENDEDIEDGENDEAIEGGSEKKDITQGSALSSPSDRNEIIDEGESFSRTNVPGGAPSGQTTKVIMIGTK